MGGLTLEEKVQQVVVHLCTITSLLMPVKEINFQPSAPFFNLRPVRYQSLGCSLWTDRSASTLLFVYDACLFHVMNMYCTERRPVVLITFKRAAKQLFKRTTLADIWLCQSQEHGHLTVSSLPNALFSAPRNVNIMLPLDHSPARLWETSVKSSEMLRILCNTHSAYNGAAPIESVLR